MGQLGVRNLALAKFLSHLLILFLAMQLDVVINPSDAKLHHQL